ncbi:hypothetical protein HN51_046122, partial [Arachis hypogaea]
MVELPSSDGNDVTFFLFASFDGDGAAGRERSNRGDDDGHRASTQRRHSFLGRRHSFLGRRRHRTETQLRIFKISWKKDEWRRQNELGECETELPKIRGEDKGRQPKWRGGSSERATRRRRRQQDDREQDESDGGWAASEEEDRERGFDLDNADSTKRDSSNGHGRRQWVTELSGGGGTNESKKGTKTRKDTTRLLLSFKEQGANLVTASFHDHHSPCQFNLSSFMLSRKPEIARDFLPSEFGMNPGRMEHALEPGRATFDDRMIKY